MVNFIAEVSSNHNKDTNRMLDFIKTAHEIGCYGIKFQLFKINELFSKEILNKSKLHRERKNWELSVDLIPMLSKTCKDYNLKFSCTPFYLEAVDILEKYVDFFKISSYELLWLDLFSKCADTGKPVYFSTGMATKSEVTSAINCLINAGCNEIKILHCNSSYPTPIEDANLSVLGSLKKLSENKMIGNSADISVGYSDHTANSGVIQRAVNGYNIDLVEFHLDLDGNGFEYNLGHCWLPKKMKKLIQDINDGFEADGSPQIKPSKSELLDRDWRADPTDGLRPLKNIRKNNNA